MKYEEKPEITIEDLLRLKRLERPPVEFWSEFEKELRAKQLAAIVNRRPWWKEAVHALAVLNRYQVPLGATAALALAFFTVREYRPSSSDALIPEIHSQRQVAVVATPARVDTVVADTKVAAKQEKAQPAVVAAPEAKAASVPVGESAPTTLVPILVGSSFASDALLSPSERSIAVNLAAARDAEPEVARQLMGPVQAFETRMIPAKAVVSDPIAQLNPGSAERRERLLATSLPVSSVNPAPTSDKLASHLSDDRLYEQISRYGLVGDRLSVKF